MIKAAITILQRGYSDLQSYQRLVIRNMNIKVNFGTKYPLVIFHEGNIRPDHMKKIEEATPELQFIWKDIGPLFRWPEEIKVQDIVDLQHFAPGYRLMCRFACYQIWDLVKEWDYVWRIDEDTFIGKINYDPFDWMKENSLDYSFGRMCYETHPATNNSIPKVAAQLLKGRWTEADYEQNPFWVPYTNLYLARTAFFLQSEVQDFLKNLTENPMFLTHRWGDHVVSGIVLKAFKANAQHLKDFEYMHGSHNCLTKNGKAVTGILSPEEAKEYDCVHKGNGYYVSQEMINV